MSENSVTISEKPVVMSSNVLSDQQLKKTPKEIKFTITKTEKRRKH